MSKKIVEDRVVSQNECMGYLRVIFFTFLKSIYMWVRFHIRQAYFPKYKNNYILNNGLAYCEIEL